MKPLATLALALLLAPAVVLAQTWAPQNSGTAEVLADVHFLTPSVGFAVADGGLLLSTADGGASWSPRTLGGGALDLQGVAFNPSDTVGLIVADNGGVFRTTDGGATWTFVATGMTDGRAAVAWGTDAVVWVAGRDGNAAVSADAGATWASRPSGSAERTEGMAAVGTQEAWVVGRSGEIRHTANGGVTWTSQPSGVSADLKDVQMLDASTGFIAGDNNTVLKTTNGGQTWTNVATSGVSGNGLFFLDASTGWVVADFGQIWFTSTGGASWTQQASGVSASFNRVHFPAAGAGWAVGDAGTVVRFAGATAADDGPGAAAPVSLALASANPVAGAARLTLTLREGQAVRAEAFDAVGRRVALLHDGPLAAGVHTLTLDVSALPAGVYVVRAVAEGSAAFRRVVVAR